MAEVDDNNDISPDDGEEQISGGAPTVPDTRSGEAGPLMDASTVAMGRMTDEDAPFPQIDGYEIIEAMPAGGQGKLYRARELTPARREVVLKFPRAGVLSSDRAVALFENEVQKAASLDHPNIARIYSSGLYDRMPFYSMEFIDGVDLGEYIREANLTQREILELVRTISLAVQHAHQRQIIHRDLKPANIMVTRDGAVPKLLDFGLAIEETELQATIDRGVGTLVYMSPEQAASESVTTQTDVYSLGVILYELLTGEHPHGFTEQEWRTLSPGQFRDRIANGEVIRPRRVSDRIDKELEALLLKALAHESSDRYASAGDLAADINNYLTGEPLTAKAPTTMYFLRKRLRKYRVPVAIAAAVLAALIGMAVFAYVNVTWERNHALSAEKDATKSKNEAIVAKQAADQHRRRVELELYRYGISEANHLSQLGMYTDARKQLNILEPNLRGWEYGHIMCRSVRRDFHELLAFPAHSCETHSVAFSPDGKRVASGGQEHQGFTIELRDTATGKELLTLKGHSWDAAVLQEGDKASLYLDWVASVAFSPDGKRLASGSRDKTIKLWDTVTGTELFTLKGHLDTVYSVAFSPDGKRLASGSGDNIIKIWDTAKGKELLTLKGHLDTVYSVAFSPDGEQLASGSNDKTIRLWDTAAGTELLTLKGHLDTVYSIAFSPDGKRLASGSGEWNAGTVKLWDTITGKELFTLKGYRHEVRSVAFSPDGKRLASGSCWSKGTIKLWSTLRGKELLTLRGHSLGVASIAFSTDGKRLASGGRGDQGGEANTVKLWDTVTGNELLMLRGHSGRVYSLAFSPDGKRLASGSGDNIIKIWDTAKGTELLTLKGHLNAVYSVAFSPDGKRMASGSNDKTIRLWDTAAGTELLTLKGHLDAVYSVAFSPDGKRLASGSADKTIRLWDTLDWTKSPKRLEGEKLGCYRKRLVHPTPTTRPAEGTAVDPRTLPLPTTRKDKS